MKLQAMRHKTVPLIAVAVLLGGCFGPLKLSPARPDWTAEQNEIYAIGEKIDRALKFHNTAHDILSGLVDDWIEDTRDIQDGTRTRPPRGVSSDQWAGFAPFVAASAAGLNYCRDVRLALTSRQPLVIDGEVVDEHVTLEDLRQSWKKALDAFFDMLIRSEALGAEVRAAVVFAQAQLIAFEAADRGLQR